VTQEEGDVDPVSAGPEAGTPEAPRTCAWCGTPAASPEATLCASCGAALAQRESIADLAIPGLTSVDAALQDYDKRPLHLRGPSPSQGMAPALIVGAMAGGPIGLAAIGGVAAVAAAEFMGTRRSGAGGVEDVGRPSEVVLQAMQHIEDGTLPGSVTAADGGSAEVVPAAEDDGRSIWRDLPPTPAFDSPAGPEQDEEGSAHGR
jgi:hypothetical protein